MPIVLVERLQAQKTAPPEIQIAVDLIIVVTHDCDLIHEVLKNEPVVELLLARAKPLADQDGQLTLGKNPRRLQFRLSQGGDEKLYEAGIHDRFLAPRELLTTAPPDGDRTLDQRTAEVIFSWISKRYFRAAFPDAFESRIHPKKSWIRDQLRKGGEHISAIFIFLTPDKELAAGEPYQLLIKATMRVADYEDKKKRPIAQSAIDKIAAKLAECAGIEVKEWELVSEQDVTLDDLHYLKRWDYDALSIQGDPPDSVAPRP
ncbi:MAG: hypothetical protein A3J70_12840 [Elusimicrobia bacterium RIFCSPHIGHO2_02_FULL_61_10]|nr:MAG: hypothetical protein A3J70_12840 [Elusimicrobia bacterium RIFCSPHIGHO2_02_FULL_61_10]